MSIINRNVIPYYINIDSRMKNTGSVVTKDHYVIEDQEIKFIHDNNLIYFHHKNHNFKSGDIISITNFIPPYNSLNIFDDDANCILDIPNGSNFMKILYPHSFQMSTENTRLAQEYYEVELCNVKGIKDTSARRTFCGVPIDLINARHKILFELDASNYSHLSLPDSYFTSSPNHFFIKFNTVACYNEDVITKIKPHLFKVIKHYIAGIDTGYLINLKNGVIIKECNQNGYHINLHDVIPLYDDSYSAKQLCVSKIINTKLCGQVNNYVMNLGKTYNNIYSVKLCSTEFPNMKNRIFMNSCNFFWTNYDDNWIHKINITSGNYTLEELSSILTEKSIDNPHAMMNEYSNYLKFSVEQTLNTRYIVIKSYKCIELCKPFKDLQKNNFTIHHQNHNAKVGTIIVLEAHDDCINIGNRIIMLNKCYMITCIIDKDNYSVRLEDKPHKKTNKVQHATQGFVRLLFPQLFSIQYEKSKQFCDLMGIPENCKLSTSINTRCFNDDFDYFYMIIKPFQTFDLNNVNIYSPFAKIQLGYNNTNCINICDNVLYNTFVDIPKIYYDPIRSISSLEISFVDPCGKPYNFGNLNHSFTLEFVTIDDSPEKALSNPNTLKNYGFKVLE